MNIISATRCATRLRLVLKKTPEDAKAKISGLPGLLTIVNAISKEVPTSFIGEAIGCVVAIVGACILVQIVGFDDPSDRTEE